MLLLFCLRVCSAVFLWPGALTLNLSFTIHLERSCDLGGEFAEQEYFLAEKTDVLNFNSTSLGDVRCFSRTILFAGARSPLCSTDEAHKDIASDSADTFKCGTRFASA